MSPKIFGTRIGSTFGLEAMSAACLHPSSRPAVVNFRRQSHIARAGPSLIQKVARVVREKASEDFDRIVKGTSKTREKLGVLEEIFTYWNLEDVDDELEELEDALIVADFGPKTAFKIVDTVRQTIREQGISDGTQIREILKSIICDVFRDRGGTTQLNLSSDGPTVILVVGVNGGGKTTTIGKLANKFSEEGASVLMAAGDTFRAAAGEQLDEWARRSSSRIIKAENENIRPDSVLYRAVDEALADEIDLLLCDTSGRLHTNWNLMEELAKCKKSISKRLQGAPHETLLVLDGTTGMNMLNQAKQFNEAVGLTGIILTKLDGSARGGAVLSVVDELGLPIKFVGVGEDIKDLQPFDPDAFVSALFPSK